MTVTVGPWQPAPPVKGSDRQMSVRELRIQNATPGELYEVTIPERGRPLYWRTLPTALPDAGLSLLIGSCFWINDDRDGFYAAAVQELVQRERLAFKVLMGDQLYVDVWAPNPLKDLRKGLAQKYERYWGDGPYQELLAACPNYVSCDDHEFWNDFPEPQMQVPYSWERLRAGERRSRAPSSTTPTRRRSTPAAGAGRRSDVAAGLVLHRRHALEPHTPGRPARRRSPPSPSGRTWRSGRPGSTAQACSCSRSRC